MLLDRVVKCEAGRGLAAAPRARKVASFTPYDTPPGLRRGPGRRGGVPRAGRGRRAREEACTGRDGDHVTRASRRSPARLAASLLQMHLREAVVRCGIALDSRA